MFFNILLVFVFLFCAFVSYFVYSVFLYCFSYCIQLSLSYFCTSLLPTATGLKPICSK